MKARILVCAVSTLILAAIHLAAAQEPGKVPRIGFLSGGSPTTNPMRDEAFKQGLRALGYVEGKNIIIEWRFAEENPERAGDQSQDR